ncbi:MAG: cupredoxin domain-containing protein [Thermotaleaceae bacterium]
MSHYQLFVLATLLIVILSSVILTFYFRRSLPIMAGMILAMVTGMNVGITAGVFFGFLFQGNLYNSTVISMVIGIIAGAASGLAIGILPSLEGFMAGLMGGMMGAMLGEMLTQNQAETMINILLTLTVSSLLLFLILPKPQVQGKNTLNKKWILKPLMTFVILGSYLIIGNQLDKKIVFSKANTFTKTHGNHISTKDGSLKELTINVHPSQYSYDPEQITLKKNQPVSIIFKNHDSIDHDIEIREILLKNLEQSNDHEDNPKMADFHLHSSANEQTKIMITPLQEGTYSFYCTIPGHKENGMEGILIIN